MGSSLTLELEEEEEEEEEGGYQEQLQRQVKEKNGEEGTQWGRSKAQVKTSSYISYSWVGCAWTVGVSMSGGLMLGWWEYQYHPTNRQLWMVPLGLILFLTPLLAWLSLVASDVLCSSSKEPQELLHSSRCHRQRHAYASSIAAEGGGELKTGCVP